MSELWFVFALGGASYGAAIGLFRERELVLRIAQRVLAAILAVLTPVLGTGLLLFLLALPFTGLNALWDATKATTPILLACVIGSLALVNIVIAGEPRDEARNPALRVGAMTLGLAVLPLAILAAIATGLRIGQYGFTPERLWALVFVVLACICGVAYLADLARGRLAWAGRIRPTNLVLLFLVCGTALLLATPLLSFNAISARDQVARLESGRIKPDKFDWAALAFDFGEAGKAALQKLETSHDSVIARYARASRDAEDGEQLNGFLHPGEKTAHPIFDIRILPRGAQAPAGLLDALDGCTEHERCTVLIVGPSESVLLTDSCFADAGPSDPTNAISEAEGSCRQPVRFVLEGRRWIRTGNPGDGEVRGVTNATSTR